jgi:hypothetical protein
MSIDQIPLISTVCSDFITMYIGFGDMLNQMERSVQFSEIPESRVPVVG